MDTSISSAPDPTASDPISCVTARPTVQDADDQPANAIAWASLLLGVAGLLPLLPFVGSVAAVITGAMSAQDHSVKSRRLARAGLALGILGVSAPVVFLFVYCAALGYPFPIHRYRSGR